MAQSYFTAAQKTLFSAPFYNLHETFARDIVIYQTAQETVISTNPDNNYLFDNAPFNSETQSFIQSGIVKARILYGKKEPLNPFNTVQSRNSAEQNMIRLEEGEARIKLDPTGAAMLRGCERVTFDGTVFNVITSPRPHGLFTPQFETFYLKKLN